MNKKELIDIVSQKKDLTKKDAEALVDTVLELSKSIVEKNVKV